MHFLVKHVCAITEIIQKSATDESGGCKRLRKAEKAVQQHPAAAQRGSPSYTHQLDWG